MIKTINIGARFLGPGAHILHEELISCAGLLLLIDRNPEDSTADKFSIGFDIHAGEEWHPLAYAYFDKPGNTGLNPVSKTVESIQRHSCFALLSEPSLIRACIQYRGQRATQGKLVLFDMINRHVLWRIACCDYQPFKPYW